MRKLIIIVILICYSCSVKNKSLTNSETTKQNWHHKSFEKDNVFGIALEDWYAENKTKKTKSKIVVAVIDSQIDLEHPDLLSQIWINGKEIPYNGIDDDKNGYVDDINGWNFVGYEGGDYYRYDHFEYTRIIRNKDLFFTENNNPKHDSLIFKRAEKFQAAYTQYYKGWLDSNVFLLSKWKKSADTLNHYFPKNDYTYSQLDSLYSIHKINDKSYDERKIDNDEDLGALIDYMRVNYEVGIKTREDLLERKNQNDSIINRNLNVDLEIRTKVTKGNTKGYGNNKMNENKFQNTHSTTVSSLIAGNTKSKIGTNGFHQNILIMPISISVSGDEHDQDIANAIYYAVDNGAKIINMSFGKDFSWKQDLVTEAMIYAEKHQVLVVHISGNDSCSIDKNPYYPNDYEYYKSEEMVANFINVGSISKRTDSTMVSKFSNYGKQNVDIFAPGEEIYVAKPGNKYGYDSGTSLAGPMVSGTAALMWLYYPKLTVQEVKSIILESGVTINQKVIKPGTENEMVPFSELCKSGKILNTYNAMKMAKEVSKRK